MVSMVLVCMANIHAMYLNFLHMCDMTFNMETPLVSLIYGTDSKPIMYSSVYQILF